MIKGCCETRCLPVFSEFPEFIQVFHWWRVLFCVYCPFGWRPPLALELFHSYLVFNVAIALSFVHMGALLVG